MADAPDTARDEAIASAYEDFHRRRGLGETPSADDYRERLGDKHGEFCDVISAEASLDANVDPEPAAPALGARVEVFGHFTLLKEIGRGGMGIVYRATDRMLERTVALKILKPEFEIDPEAVRRFRAEAQKLAHVAHERIVGVYETGDIGGRHFIAMELVEGESLDRLIESGRAPGPSALCQGLEGIALALHSLHQKGLVHRDVKPANIMVRPDGSMVLLDFGLARSTNAAPSTEIGVMKGTVPYMSPQQVLGERFAKDPRTDVYGLGVTMYEALSGRRPFIADDMAALIQLIRNGNPPKIRNFRPEVPIGCESIALRAMAKFQTRRYQTAADMAAALRDFVEGRRIPSPPGTIAGLFDRAVERWKPIAAGLALLAVGAWWFEFRPGHLIYDQGVPLDVAISVDGAPEALGPLNLKVSSGTHRVVFSHPLCDTIGRDVTVGSGCEVVLPWTLSPKPESVQAWAELVAKQKGLKAPKPPPELPVETSGTRGGGVALGRVEVLFPRGDVRLADLRRCIARVGLEGPVLDVTLEFRRARDKKLLWTRTFEPETADVVLPMPDEVRRELTVDDSVTWSLFPGATAPLSGAATAEFHVVADAGVAQELEKIDRTLASAPAGIRALFRIQAFEDAGLETAAFEEAFALAAADAHDARGHGVMYGILESWGLDKSVWGDRVYDRLVDPHASAFFLVRPAK